MKFDKKEYRISILGEFTDKNLEREFINYYLGRNIRYIRPVILALGLLYMFFIIPDYFLIKSPETFMAILANRTIFLLLVIILFIAIKKVKNYTNLSYWLTIYEILGAISFLVIFGQYESPNYFIQTFGVMIIILGIFLAPNKWANTLIASFLISITFFILSAYYIKEIIFAEYSAGIVYVLIVLILSSIASFRSSYYIRKQYVYSRELLIQANTDALTGINNRAKFNEELERWVDYAKRYRTPLSVVIFDFDNFKNVNDTYGHLIGDKVIVDTINIIKGSIRLTDVFARWGGDEFVLLLTNTNKQQAIELTERLRRLISKNVFEKVGKVTCSFGLGMFKENDNADTLINRCDQLLYKAKKEGKNRLTS